ncbi:unnamed protein product [Pocillopora meandrina]|uniref:Uncharacterized protein n=1 Tax=Pocillopora meandrina TaxID=46732 RepID=A0AAU9XB43_9CNID|nr:unnamed protein product [Pocillopora meandrina]
MTALLQKKFSYLQLVLKYWAGGDSAYPLASWLQKPFPEATRDPEEIAFNKALLGARVAVE